MGNQLQALSDRNVILLRRLIVVMFVTTLGAGASIVLEAGSFTVRNLGFIAAGSVCALCYFELRKGRVDRGLIFLCWGVWLSACVFGVIVAGIRTPFLLVLPVALMICAWVQGVRAVSVMTLATIAYLVALTIAEPLDWLPVPLPRSSFQFLLVYSAVCALAGVVSASFAETLKRRLRKEKTLNETLKESEARYRSIIAVSNTGAWEYHLDSGYQWCSPEYFAMLGYQQRDFDLSGKPNLASVWSELLHPDDRTRAADHFAEYIEKGSIGTYENHFRMRHREGRWLWIWARGQTLRGPSGEVTNLTVGTHIDITERKQSEEVVRLSEERYRTIFQTSLDAININRLDDERCLDVNQGLVEMTGYRRDELIGHTSLELDLWFDPDERQRFFAALRRDGKCVNHEARFRRKNGEMIWALDSAAVIELDGVPCTISIRRDITKRKQAEERITQLAFFDQLTDLPNRILLQDRLKQAMTLCAERGCYGALLLIDLDHFKTLNNTLGHETGDLLLKQVAERLTDCAHEGDTLARIGGDEFVLLLENLSGNRHEAASRAETAGKEILTRLNQAYQLDTYTHHSTASIGVALFTSRQLVEELLKQAELALYQAKATGRNTLRFFEIDMQSALAARSVLEAGLREALLKEQFLIHYQVQVDSSNRTIGVEALLRWRHPERGLVSPGEFIPVAEDTGLIFPIGQWVLATACKQLTLWASEPDFAHLSIAVNVSISQFHHQDFVDQVLSALELSGANPQRLKLELTESLLVHNIEDIIAKMTALKAKGVAFSLDDFGTGYSSLSYLKRLPLDQLKIDQGFVRDILTDSNDVAIAKMVVVLAESLGLAVIAEGVETEAQRDFLKQQGCHAYQGYLFSRPLPLDEFEAFVKRPRKEERPRRS